MRTSNAGCADVITQTFRAIGRLSSESHSAQARAAAIATVKRPRRSRWQCVTEAHARLFITQRAPSQLIQLDHSADGQTHANPSPNQPVVVQVAAELAGQDA